MYVKLQAKLTTKESKYLVNKPLQVAGMSADNVRS